MVHDFPSVNKPDTFYTEVKELKSNKHSFILSPTQWRQCNLGVVLNWKEVRFNKKNLPLIPQERGLYAFIVRHGNDIFPSGHGYIFYIGETGNKTDVAKRNLRVRFNEYLKEAEIFKKRPKVYAMLSGFRDDLIFSYTEIPDKNVDLVQIEEKLCDAILPPAVTDDFSAEVRPLLKAVW